MSDAFSFTVLTGNLHKQTYVQRYERRNIIIHRYKHSRFVLWHWNVKPGFHYSSWRPVNSGACFDTRVDGCQKMHQSSRAVNSARQLRQWKPGFTDIRCIHAAVSSCFIVVRPVQSYWRVQSYWHLLRKLLSQYCRTLLAHQRASVQYESSVRLSSEHHHIIHSTFSTTFYNDIHSTTDRAMYLTILLWKRFMLREIYRTVCDSAALITQPQCCIS